MDAELLDTNPFVGPSRLFQPNTNFRHQFHTVHRAQVDHKLPRQATGDLKHFSNVIEVKEIAVQ
ncbi:hypothetical protein NUK47_11400 [Aeromonas hydrophila]|uniref:hypothetical protein n=1 Tax=Aeromonas hydrophila TaxID=644 RepID=UPI00214D95EE|nr:hypothetical protein [Aeromonas hydrophila]MCR3909381.1 hypothetical protein [Aeromonas hydrophila]